MPTIAETLLQTGFTKEQIEALDPKLITVFTGIQTSADQAAVKAESDRVAAEQASAAAKAAQEAAELQKRSVDEFWQNTYNPGVTAWEAERAKLAEQAANAEAKAAYYEKQRESYLTTLGIKPEDAPAFTPPANNNNGTGTRDGQGRFVPGTTGSPVFDPQTIISRVGDGMNTISDIQWRYQTLYGGQSLPIPPSELIRQADAMKLSPSDYAARTFKFAEKEEERRQAAAKAHDDQVASAAATAKESEWKAKMDAREAEFAAKEKLRAEQGGNNPEVRVAVSSRIPELQRQVISKDLPDPLMMNENQRRANTTKMIRDQIAAKDQAAA